MEIENRDRKISWTNEIWCKYEQQTKDEDGIADLKKDTTFLDKLLLLLKADINDLLTKDKKSIVLTALKVFLNYNKLLELSLFFKKLSKVPLISDFERKTR